MARMPGEILWNGCGEVRFPFWVMKSRKLDSMIGSYTQLPPQSQLHDKDSIDSLPMWLVGSLARIQFMDPRMKLYANTSRCIVHPIVSLPVRF